MPNFVEPLPITFVCKAKGYHSEVTLAVDDAEMAAEKINEWLEFQLRYLSVIKSGEVVEVKA